MKSQSWESWHQIEEEIPQSIDKEADTLLLLLLLFQPKEEVRIDERGVINFLATYPGCD